MLHKIKSVIRLGKDERGATTVEYALILALIVLAMVAALTVLADTTTTMWYNVSNEVVSAG